MFSSGQDSYERVQTSGPFSGGYVRCNPTHEDMLETFDISMLDREDAQSFGGSVGSPGASDYPALTSFAEEDRSYMTDGHGLERAYGGAWIAEGTPDVCSELSLLDAAHGYPTLTTTAAAAGGCWPAAGPDHQQPFSPWPSDPSHLPVPGHSSWPCDLDHLPIPGQMSSTATLTERKLKVYEWPPQSDPELEKKRMRAIKALRNRLKGSQQEEEQYARLTGLSRDVHQLQQEKQTRQQTVAALEAHLRRLALAASAGQGLVPGITTHHSSLS
ncbi:uncharacterized protein [Panulirus ornatus]|uniref:uncharacterized protein n=1 Tax=Panulirus ornatus TaxID=150431 RepID=UPI003A858349